MRESRLLYMPIPDGHKVFLKKIIKYDYQEQGLARVTSTAKL